MSATYTIGQRVTMTWTGDTRDGVVIGEEYPESLPTGARFLPVQWADGSRDNVDSRVLSVSHECVCSSGILGFRVHRHGCRMALPLPLTVDVSDSGAVAIEAPTRLICMSRFSERARRLTMDFGAGQHVIATTRDVADIPTHTLTDLAEAVA